MPELAIDWLLDSPEQRWRVIDGTLCFADISGFTALAEKLARRGRVGGEELVETLSRIFGAMLDVARERGGSLLKFGGDALLLLFSGPEHAARAASTAVEMRRALRGAAEIPTSVGRLRLSMSVGIHSGPIHFFLVGASHRELVLLGPTVTTAVLTENAADAGEIAVSAATAAELPATAVKRRADGELLLRWRRAPQPGAGPAKEREIDGARVSTLLPSTLARLLEPGPPEPEHRVACIAFIRFSGTDALLAREGAEAVAEALERTIGTIQDCLVAEGVTLLAIDVDRDGGKLFLGSGVPHAGEDDEGAMLRALRRIVESGVPLPLQIGVNRGHVFAAEVGSPRRAAYSAMGDTTNTAARIASKAPPGSLFAHPSVLDYSRTLFEVKPAGPFVLKGKKAPLVVYDVGEETGTRQREGLAAFSFVGREAELRTVRETLSAAAAGRGSVVSIVGAAGLGKSRLLREALAEPGPLPVLRLRAEPYGSASPFRVFRDPIRELLRIERADPASMRAALERGVARAAPDLSPLLALIGDVAHVEVPPSAEVAAIEPRFRPDRSADAVIRLLEASHPGGLVLAVEDVQWADGASAHLLGRLAAACGERAWGMLVTRREGDGGFAPAAARAIQLGPLSEKSIEALVVAATEAAPLRQHELEIVVRRAGGNPLFAEEILRAAREVGSVEAVPDSLEAAVAAQIDGLPPESRRVLRHASVLGRSFSRQLLAELLESAGLAFDLESSSSLEGFLEPDGAERLRFRNGLARDATYEGLAFRLRRRLHVAAAEALERTSVDPAANADALALHFSLAGDDARTWRWACTAGERAAHAYANGDAARLYGLALDASRRLADVSDAERMGVWNHLGDVCARAGMFEASLDAYRRASRLCTDPIARADLLLGSARARERAGALSAALRDLSRGEQLVEFLDSNEAERARARLASFSAMVLLGRDRPRQALRRARQAVELARRASERNALGLALMVLDLARVLIEGPGEGEHLREALSIFEELGDLRMQANVRANLGFVTAHAGRWNETVGWLTSARDNYLRCGDAVGAAYPALNLGEMLVKQRRFEAAEPVLKEALRVMRATEFAEGAAMAQIQLARILIERGAADEADAMLDRVGAELTRIGKAPTAVEAAVVRASGRVRRGDAAAALELLDRATAAAGNDAILLRPAVAWARSTALAALGRFDEAEQEVRAGLAAAREQRLPYEEALLLIAKAKISAQRGREPDPADAEAAHRILRDLGVAADHCREITQSPST